MSRAYGKRGDAEVHGEPGCSKELLRARACRGGDGNNQQVLSLWRTTSEEKQQSNDRSKQDTDLARQTGQFVAPDGKKKKKRSHEQQQRCYSV